MPWGLLHAARVQVLAFTLLHVGAVPLGGPAHAMRLVTCSPSPGVSLSLCCMLVQYL